MTTVASAVLALLLITGPAEASATAGTVLPAQPRADAPPTKAPPGSVGADRCGLERHMQLIGGPVPDAEALEALRGAEGTPWRIRVIRPGEPVTMDHLAGRLNLVLDRHGRVLRLHCG